MQKTPVKVKKDRQKTVGGVAHTILRYLLLEGVQNHVTTENRILCPLAFLRKGGGQQISCVMTGILTLNKHHSRRPLELSYLQGQHTEPKESFQPCKRVLEISITQSSCGTIMTLSGALRMSCVLATHGLHFVLH